jgi:hypothetical protein
MESFLVIGHRAVWSGWKDSREIRESWGCGNQNWAGSEREENLKSRYPLLRSDLLRSSGKVVIVALIRLPSWIS